jgi:sugar phosphate isomerase/epimerase
MSQIPVSIQLYTLRDDIGKELVLTLKRVAEIGYQYVELAGFGGVEAPELKQILRDFGLQPSSAHVGIDALQSDGVAKVLEDYQEIGCPSLIVPFLGGEWRQGRQGYERTAEVLNEIGSRLNTEGFQLGYHNHDFEFKETFDGKTGLQLLMEGTSPDLVKLELDTYWALFAGHNPVDVIKTYGDRVEYLHIKDMDPDDRKFAPVGTGLLPLDEIVDAAKSVGSVKYLIVEQDSATKQTPLEAVEISYKNLQAKGYV